MKKINSSNLSVIIVNYNCAAEVEKCVFSLRKFFQAEIEIVLIDNASDDEDKKKLKTIGDNFNCIVVWLNKNLGFAAGCNAGVANASCKWLYFLNPDCEVSSDITDLCQHLSWLQEDKIYTTEMSDQFGFVYKNIYAIPKLFNLVKISFGLKGIYWAQGSSLLMSVNAYSKIGGWDESYFMYAEDLDICYKAAKRGIVLEKLNFCIKHKGGGSTSNLWSSYERLCRVYSSQLLFFEKYGNKFEFLVVGILLLTRESLKRKKIKFLEWKAFFHALK